MMNSLIANQVNLENYFEKPNLYDLTTKKFNEKLNLSEFLQWGRRNPARFCEEIFNVQLLDYQRYCFDSSWNTPFVVWAMTRNGGKALSLDTPILTPTGKYKLMKDIEVGDCVVGDNGLPARVISTSPIFENHKCYEIVFDDGETIIADANHIWSVYVKGSIATVPVDRTTKQIAKDYTYYRNDSKSRTYKYAVPTTKPVVHLQKDVPIDPYIFGMWVSKGYKYLGHVVVDGYDYEAKLKCITDTGYNIVDKRGKQKTKKRVVITDFNGKPLQVLISGYNQKHKRYIPEEYLIGSIDQRLALIQGLMDMGGNVTSSGTCKFYDNEYQVVQDFVRLLDSLGIKSTVDKEYIRERSTKRKILKHYICTFVTSKQMPCFRIPRKFDKLKDVLPPIYKRKKIINVKPVRSVPTK